MCPGICSDQISNGTTVEKMLSRITFQAYKGKKKPQTNSAKKAYYRLREVLSSSETRKGVWPHQLSTRSEASGNVPPGN